MYAVKCYSVRTVVFLNVVFTWGNFQHETYKLSNKELIYVGIWLLLKVPIQLSHIGNNDEWNNTSKHQ